VTDGNLSGMYSLDPSSTPHRAISSLPNGIAEPSRAASPQLAYRIGPFQGLSIRVEFVTRKAVEPVTFAIM
jgi:hypothetical protein